MPPIASNENVRAGQEEHDDEHLFVVEEAIKKKKGEEKRDRSPSDEVILSLAKKEILAKVKRKSRSWSKGKILTSSSTKKNSEDIAHEEKMNAIKSEHEDEIRIYLKEIDDLKARIKISITANDEEKLELNKKFAKKNEELANQINKFREKTASDALTHEKESEELSTSHKESTDAIVRNHKDKIVGLSDEISKLKTSIKHDAAASGKCYDAMETKLEQKIMHLVASHKKECAEIKTNLEEKLTKMTNSHEKEHIARKNEHAKMKTNLEEKIMNLTNSREKERVARKNDHAEMKTDLEEKIMSLATSHENECAKIERELKENLKFQATLERRNVALKKENKELLSRNEDKINMYSRGGLCSKQKMKKLNAELAQKYSAREEEWNEMLIFHKNKLNQSTEEIEMMKKESNSRKEKFVLLSLLVLLLSLLFARHLF